jgi:hypothetical protein
VSGGAAAEVIQGVGISQLAGSRKDWKQSVSLQIYQCRGNGITGNELARVLVCFGNVFNGRLRSPIFPLP